MKSDDSAAYCQLALIQARQGRLSEAVRQYRLALKPAKLEQLNDSECLVILDHVLDQAVAVRGPLDRQAVAEYRKIKQGMKSDAQAAVAQNTPPRTLSNDEPFQQAALRSGPQ